MWIEINLRGKNYLCWNDKKMSETTKRNTNNSASKSRKSKNDIIRSTLGMYLKQKNYSVSNHWILFIYIFSNLFGFFWCSIVYILFRPNLNVSTKKLYRRLLFALHLLSLFVYIFKWFCCLCQWLINIFFLFLHSAISIADEWKISKIRLAANANSWPIWCYDDARRWCS